MVTDKIKAYLESHRGDFEEQLKELIRIPQRERPARSRS